MDPLEELDDVDLRIVDLVMEGATNRQIASRVGLAEGTVKWRLHRLYRRLDVESRVQFSNEVRRLRRGS